MTTCPKCGYVRKPVETAPDWQCPSCGIAYVKYHAAPPIAAVATLAVAPAGAALAVGKARLIVESEEGLRWYALGALAWVGFIAFVLTGLFTTFKEAPFIAVPFFGVFLWFGWKAASKGLSNLSAYMNFGTVQLGLERAPSVGGALRGYVEFESSAASLTTVEAEVVCTREIPKAPNGSTAAVKDVLHSEKSVFAVHVEPGHRRAPFAFAIPEGSSPSGEAEASGDDGRVPTVTWTLRLAAPNAGGELARSFEVAVLPAAAVAEEPVSQQPAAESAIALVVANLLPLALVLLGVGSVGGLVVLYWAENVVIGFYTVLRMLESGRGSAGEKVGKSLFFCVHYGMFCFVHGVFVMNLFSSREQLQAMHSASQWTGPLFFFQELWMGVSAMGLFSPRALLLPLLALIVSHGVSFYTNYLRNGRYLTSTPQDSFMRPYPRMVLLHVFILGGAFFISQRGTAVLPLAALVIVKTMIDLGLHRRSNRVL